MQIGQTSSPQTDLNVNLRLSCDLFRNYLVGGETTCPKIHSSKFMDHNPKYDQQFHHVVNIYIYICHEILVNFQI